MLASANIFNGRTLQPLTDTNDNNSKFKLCLSSSSSTSYSLHLLRRRPPFFPPPSVLLPNLRKKRKKRRSGNEFLCKASLETTGGVTVTAAGAPYSVKIPVGDRYILVETGHMGRQASGAVTATDGETLLEFFCTCPICKELLIEVTIINECLHKFCKICIEDKIIEKNLHNCPIRKIDLGVHPLQKLRVDHHRQSLRNSVKIKKKQLFEGRLKKENGNTPQALKEAKEAEDSPRPPSTFYGRGKNISL